MYSAGVTGLDVDESMLITFAPVVVCDGADADAVVVEGLLLLPLLCSCRLLKQSVGLVDM